MHALEALVARIDRSAALHARLAELAQAHHEPATLGVVDALFGAAPRPMFSEQLDDYVIGFSMASAAMGLTDPEEDAELRREPALDCSPRHSSPTVHPCWTWEEYSERDRAQQRAWLRDRTALADQLLEELLAVLCRDYAWFISGWLSHGDSLYCGRPTERPTGDDAVAFYAALKRTPEPSQALVDSLEGQWLIARGPTIYPHNLTDPRVSVFRVEK